MNHSALSGLFAVLTLAAAETQPANLDLRGYASPQGEIRTLFEGDVVDPYFATKSLLEARAAGMTIEGPAIAWIEWALSVQSPSGLFQRYCRGNSVGETWQACASADADDAMLAVWLNLLAELSPSAPDPRWSNSVERALDQLAQLYEPERGIYLISRQQPVGLLADNMEVIAAFRALARMYERQGDRVREHAMTEQATWLRQNVDAVFFDRKRGRYRASTQARSRWAFYPDEVAQIYPWLLDAPVAGAIATDAAYGKWIARNRKSWLALRSDHYPWGLVALAALRFDDRDSAACWLRMATPLRHGPRWNVLEEAAWQAVQSALSPGADDPKNCPSGASNADRRNNNEQEAKP